MNRKQRIKEILNINFKEWEIDVIDDSYKHAGHNEFDGTQESHFKISLKKISNNKYNRLELHRKINDLLKDEFLEGLHALEINII